MKTLPIEKVLVAPNRQRRVFDINALQDLVTSISETTVGLQNPIVVRQEGSDFYLVSGERRLRAIKDIYALGGMIRHGGEDVPSGEIPYTSVGELSELDAEEAELSENIHRADLTWQERADATSKLARLRARQAVAQGCPIPSVAAIALEVRGSSEGSFQESTRREMLVAEHLADPDVAKAKTLDEAFKILRRKEKDSRFSALAEEVGQTFTSGAHKVINEDCLTWLTNCPAGTFDVILTDPPYGMGADGFGDSGGVAQAHFYEDNYETWSKLIPPLAAHLFRVAKENAHLYMFCDIDRLYELREILADAGWRVHRTPLIWHKGAPGYGTRMPWPDKGPKRVYELIVYAMKGERPVRAALGDVLTYPLDVNLGHSAQKPVELYKDLLGRSALPGDAVLDPFAGTGPILAAATDLLCRATAIEQNPGAYGIALNRLKELSL